MKMIQLAIALLLGVQTTPIYANGVLFGPPHVITVTTTSTKYADQNSLRTYLLIQNKSATIPVIVKFGSVQTGTEGITIAPGGNYEPNKAPSNSFYLVTASSTAAVTWQEGQ